MPGLTDWFEIFKAGTHTNSEGKKSTWTIEDLDKIVNNFSSPVPCVLGHPKSSDPAFGWADIVKREGEHLYAKCNKTVEAFENAVKEGLFPNRSISIDKETGRINHIGFLGAVLPGVEGLAPIEFNSQDSGEIIEFSSAQTQNNEALKFANDEISRLAQDVEALKSENKALKEQLVKNEFEINRKNHDIFCDELVKSGNLTPAQKNYAVEFMCKMDNSNIVEFSSIDNKKTALDHFKDFLKTLPQQVEFGQMQKPQNTYEFSNPQELAQQAELYMKDMAEQGKSIDFETAVKEVYQKGENNE